MAGGAAGVSSNTSYIESATGVGEGARTGLASVVTGVMFLLATVFTPLVAVIPYEAATPALVLVGVWSRFGYGMLILLAGLQEVLGDLQDAAVSETWLRSAAEALASTVSSVFDLLQLTLESGERELQLVQAQDAYANPRRQFEVSQIR